eukprot:TRINITY_DN5165_c0_g4_i1.p5 TRINITY_DN5165_c0_g4~~TRINITY_DN5165_c0_g4_i1.p5  ORF type:complete len:101 (-),score=36.72 TRINITY_DN5165_c0_g4_i1:295-597(-)
MYSPLTLSKEAEDLMFHLSYSLLHNSNIYFNQFLLIFSGPMLRGALQNLKAYICRKQFHTSLETRLMEYQRLVYLRALSNSPAEAKILKALLEHRNTRER